MFELQSDIEWRLEHILENHPYIRLVGHTVWDSTKSDFAFLLACELIYYFLHMSVSGRIPHAVRFTGPDASTAMPFPWSLLLLKSNAVSLVITAAKK